MLIEILAVLNIVAFFVMFVGYWTYADYYTNISSTNKLLYWIIHGYLYVICTIAYTIEFFGDHNWSKAYIVSTYIIGYMTVALIAGTLMQFVLRGFMKSRKYFGKKRNKI